MKIVIWCNQDYLGCAPGVKAKKIWEGNMDAVPRAGDTITIDHNFCSETILSVDFFPDTNEAHLNIAPDYKNEYTPWDERALKGEG